MGKLNIGIIGVGRWGLNYFKTLNELSNARVKWICATKESTLKEALNAVRPQNNVETATDYRKILKDEEVDAVAIASSGSTHYEIAKAALKNNKHVVVEKPVAFSSAHVKELIRLSKERKKVFMAGHLHLYNPAIRKIKQDIDTRLFGKINYFSMVHFGNGPVRNDMGAIWDFFPHSISIFLYLLGQLPLKVSVNGASCLQKGIEDIAVMDMNFSGKIFATSAASWLYPLKKMELAVVGEKLYAAFDDYAAEKKLKYYDSRPKISRGKTEIKDKGCYAPEFRDAKPLTEQLKHFLDCIENNKTPLTGGEEALKVTKVLEAAQKSLDNRGSMTKVIG